MDYSAAFEYFQRGKLLALNLERAAENGNRDGRAPHSAIRMCGRNGRTCRADSSR
jgi:hypothetical protein